MDADPYLIIRYITLIILLVYPTTSTADTDGYVCIGAGFVTINASGIYIPIDSAALLGVTYHNGIISDLRKVTLPDGMSTQPVCGSYTVNADGDRLVVAKASEAYESFYLPYEKSRVVELLDSEEQYSYSLVVASHDQSIKNQYGAAIQWHFSARVVASDQRLDYVSSTLIGAGIRLETID